MSDHSKTGEMNKMNEGKIMKFAKLYAENCLGIKEGDRILILTDNGVSSSDEPGMMRDALIKALDEEGADPCVVSFGARQEMGSCMPDAAIAACMESDVIVSFNTSLLLYSGSFPGIYQGGTTSRRIAMFPAGSSIAGQNGYFEKMMPDTKEEIFQMAEMTKKCGDVLSDGRTHKIHLTAANGTDLTLNVGQLSGSAHTGICAPGKIELIPAGILSLGVDEGSAEGTLVTDYASTLKKKRLEGKICFDIRGGYAVSVYGGPEADEFKAAADTVKRPEKEKFNIAEFGLGFNPRAKADGQVTDGENILGGAHIGIGANSLFGGNVVIPEWHVDCILPDVTVEADGRMLLKNGEYLI